MTLSVQAPNWLDTTLYPFENKYIQLNAGKMHYVDEGKGAVILFVHGTPAWSFLYREYILELSKNHRCIAIDHIGFGLSEKPVSFDGKPQSHTANLNEFIRKLELNEITIVVHDFGGPIGLSSAIENHTNIKQVVLFNTWLWETKNDPKALKINKILTSGIGRFLYLRMNFSTKVLLKKGFHNKAHLSKKIHKHYIRPFPNTRARLSLLNLGKSLVGSSDWYQSQWENLNKLEQKPWLILWGTKDQFITTENLQKWTRKIAKAEVKKFECGHFIQEEKTKETIQLMKAFMQPHN